mgnify:CR=1 FL=1|jgi:hypothetical protein
MRRQIIRLLKLYISLAVNYDCYHFDVDSFYHPLQEIAGKDITFAKLALLDHPEIVKEVIKQAVLADTSNKLNFDTCLDYFLTDVNICLGYPDDFMENLLASTFFKENHTMGHIYAVLD